jgi:hypothetical protein
MMLAALNSLCSQLLILFVPPMAAASGLPGDEEPLDTPSDEESLFITDDSTLVDACLSPPEAFEARLRALNVDSTLLVLPTTKEALGKFSARWYLGNKPKASKVVDQMPSFKQRHLQVRESFWFFRPSAANNVCI